MEWTELENIWKEQDKKIANTIQLNKEILRRMLIARPEKRVNWIKIKAGLNVMSPLIFALLLLIMKVSFQITAQFCAGLSMFLIIYLIIYIWDVKYFFLLRKIDFSDPVLQIKKTVARIEQYVIKKTRLRYFLAPFAIIGIFMMIIQKPVLNAPSVVMFILVILVFLATVYYTFKYSVFERFRKLNSEIEEIVRMEKE